MRPRRPGGRDVRIGNGTRGREGTPGGEGTRSERAGDHSAEGVRTIEVKVRPRSAVQRLEGPDPQGLWHAWLKAPPVEGRANEELIALLAERFGCRRSAVTIRGGAAARLKRVRIESA